MSDIARALASAASASLSAFWRNTRARPRASASVTCPTGITARLRESCWSMGPLAAPPDPPPLGNAK